METGASTLTHTQMLLDYAGAVGGVAAICLTDWEPHPHPRSSAALTRVESEDLARFEGEGGLEAPEPVRPAEKDCHGRSYA